MKLFEIQITAYKTFYVEAESQEDALEKDVVDDEQGRFGNYDWEHDTTTARELGAIEARYVRDRHSKQIAKEDE